MFFDIGLIGFGEAGSSFAREAGWRDRAIVYDRKIDEEATRASKRRDYVAAGVAEASACEQVASGADLILSLVTADQVLAAARAAARAIRPGALFCDGNSVAPSTKQEAARIVEAAGGRYVDMAIMAPVDPARCGVPILVSGPASAEASAALEGAGFTAVRVAGEAIGDASSIKMIRSVMVKGIEALTAECVLAASRAGVLGRVLSSLDASEKPRPWLERADYNLDRMLVHGRRRAAEMEEVARTLADLGIDPAMTRGTIVRQRALGDAGTATPPTGLAAKLAIIEEKEGPSA